MQNISEFLLKRRKERDLPVHEVLISTFSNFNVFPVFHAVLNVLWWVHHDIAQQLLFAILCLKEHKPDPTENKSPSGEYC